MKKIGFFAPILITFTYSLLLVFKGDALNTLTKIICIVGCYCSQYIMFKILDIFKENDGINYLEYLFYLILPGIIYTILYFVLGKVGSGIVIYTTGVVSAYAFIGSIVVFVYILAMIRNI